MRRRQAALPSSSCAETERQPLARTARAAHPRSAVLTWLALLLSLISVLVGWWTNVKEAPHVGARPQLHIFAAPKPFVGVDGQHQLRALRSWLALRPRPKVTLLGSGLEHVAHRYGVRAQDVESTFLGVPLFSAVVAAANATRPISGKGQSDIVILLNSDIVLFDDFSVAIGKLGRSFDRSWLALGGRWDVDSIPRAPRFGVAKIEQTLSSFVREAGTLHTYGGVDVWAWPAGQLAPVDGGVPPFVLGRGRYDNWFTNALLQHSNGIPTVVDISEAATLAHVRHDHHLVASSSGGAIEDADHSFWMANPAQRFELYVNNHLAVTRGDFAAQQGTVLHAPYKLAMCYERQESRCVMRRMRPHVCRCEHAPFVGAAQSDPFVVAGSRVILCGLRSNDVVENISRKQIAARWPVSGGKSADNVHAVFGLPLTRRDIISVIRSRITDEIALLIVASSAERTLVANTVCSARRVGAFPRLVVAALDDDLYRFGMLQGWPVFLHSTRQADRSRHDNFGFLARLRATHALVSRGVGAAVLPAGAYLRRNLTRHLAKIVAPKADVALGVHRGAFEPQLLLFVRPTPRSQRFLNAVLNASSPHSPARGLDFAACGVQGIASAHSRFCRGGGTLVQLLDERDGVLLQSRSARHQGDAAVVVPDEHESPHERMQILSANKLMLFDEQLQLCRP